jgi:phage/plasmid-associated DNA primase
LKFLYDCSGGDVELIRFLQQWCGYCLTGDTREHALIFVYGGGGNGKSVFMNTVSGLLGDYATVAAMDTFTASQRKTSYRTRTVGGRPTGDSIRDGKRSRMGRSPDQVFDRG